MNSELHVILSGFSILTIYQIGLLDENHCICLLYVFIFIFSWICNYLFNSRDVDAVRIGAQWKLNAGIFSFHCDDVKCGFSWGEYQIVQFSAGNVLMQHQWSKTKANAPLIHFRIEDIVNLVTGFLIFSPCLVEMLHNFWLDLYGFSYFSHEIHITFDFGFLKNMTNTSN